MDSGHPECCLGSLESFLLSFFSEKLELEQTSISTHIPGSVFYYITFFTFFLSMYTMASTEAIKVNIRVRPLNAREKSSPSCYARFRAVGDAALAEYEASGKQKAATRNARLALKHWMLVGELTVSSGADMGAEAEAGLRFELTGELVLVQIALASTSKDCPSGGWRKPERTKPFFLGQAVDSSVIEDRTDGPRGVQAAGQGPDPRARSLSA